MMKNALRWIDFVQYPLVLGLAIWYGPRTPLLYVGLSISIAAAMLSGLARWQLGDSFSVNAEARRLVTSGLYSRIRHPVYLFGDLAYLGALVALQVWWVLPIWLAMALVDMRRARREDSVLAEAFGSEYAAYRARTWFWQWEP